MMISRSARSILTRTSQRGLHLLQTKKYPVIFKGAHLNSSNDVIGASLFSSQDESSGFLSRLKDKISPSQEDAYKEQMASMANQEKWTLENFMDQIKGQMGWKTKIPGMGSTAVVKELKDMNQLLEAAIEVMGKDTGAPELVKMDKKKKLQIGIKCGADLKDINSLVANFERMEILHKVLRYRLENGLELPVDEESSKTMMTTDFQKALSAQEIKQIRSAQMKAQKKKMRK